MTYTEIKDLLSSGFTAEQITLLTTSGVLPSTPEPETVPTTAPVVDSVVETPVKVGEDLTEPVQQVSSPTETEESKPDPLAEIKEQLKAVQEENKQLREIVQSNNIRDRTMSTVTAPDASDMLAEIIRPSFKKGG